MFLRGKHLPGLTLSVQDAVSVDVTVDDDVEESEKTSLKLEVLFSACSCSTENNLGIRRSVSCRRPVTGTPSARDSEGKAFRGATRSPPKVKTDRRTANGVGNDIIIAGSGRVGYATFFHLKQFRLF